MRCACEMRLNPNEEIKMNWNQRTVASVLLAASLAFSGATHAKLMIDSSVDSVIYAKETLPTATAQGSAGNFHVINHDLAVAGPAGIGSSANDRLFVSYELEGMVFSTPVSGGVSGGAVGGTNVTFRIATETASTATITHTFRLAVSASGGSITRTVTNESLPSSIPRTESLTARIMVSSALKETVVESNPVTARAAHDFMAFGGTATNPDLKAKLGSLQVGVQAGTVGAAADPSANPPVAAKADTRYRNAASGSAKGGTTATGSPGH